MYPPRVPPKPKKKCCVTKPRCKRCPIRLMAEGRLPDGYTVKKRKLVKAAPEPVGKKKSKASKKVKQPIAA